MCQATDLGNPIKKLWEDTREGLFGATKADPNPAAERLKAEQDAANAANGNIAFNALRKRKAAGRVASDSVLSGGAAAPDSTILGSGGR
jgi:hypothetical protein